ncbi:hypothetical protein Tco_0331999 [Tanacetum coccineum]
MTHTTQSSLTKQQYHRKQHTLIQNDPKKIHLNDKMARDLEYDGQVFTEVDFGIPYLRLKLDFTRRLTYFIIETLFYFLSIDDLLEQLLEYMDVHDNDASESSQPSWGKIILLCGRTVADFRMHPERLPSSVDKKQWSLVCLTLRNPLCTLMKVEECSATSMFQNLLKIGMLVLGGSDSETSPNKEL